MEENANVGRMCGNIDLRNKETEISNLNQGLVLSGSGDSGASTLSNSTKKEEDTPKSLAENMDYGHFFEDHSVGKTEGPINIFHQNDIETIFYIQHENSFMCAIIAAMLSMVYSAKDFDHSKARPNLSRFIRNEISARKIANLVVTDIKGIPLSEVFSSLVKCFGAPGCHEIDRVIMFRNKENRNYEALRGVLEEGRAIAFTIEVFPALLNKSRKRYLGEISEYYTDKNEPRPDKANRSFHALVIVGIMPRVGTIGPMLLVQDSCETRPIYELSLSLLMSMDIKALDFFTVCDDWKLRENCEYLMTHESRASFVGSPFQVTSSGDVVVVPQNQEPLRDMSEYFTHVEDPDYRYTYAV